MTDGASLGALENVTLQLDNGAVFTFSGRQFAGGSWYDEETGVLTRQNLYVTTANEHVYSIVSGRGQSRSRRAYRVSMQGDHCVMNDGSTQLIMSLEMLMMAVRTLTGLDKDAVPSLEAVEETLRASNC